MPKSIIVEGKTTTELVEVFKRSTGAIQSRIRKVIEGR